MAAEFQGVQLHPGARLGQRLDVGVRLGAVRAGERPEKIQLHLGLAIRTGLEPDIVCMTSVRE